MDEDEFNFPSHAEDHVDFLESDNIPFEHRSFREVLNTPVHALPRTVIPKVDGPNNISNLPALMKSFPYDGRQHNSADPVSRSIAPEMSHRWNPVRKVSTKWNKDETDKFYKVLEKFGTDLSLISLLFPGKSRSEVKKKLDFERKSNPERIFEAMNCVSCDNDVDMAEFEKGVDDCEAYRNKAIVPLTQDEVAMLSDFQGITSQNEELTRGDSQEITREVKDENKTLITSSSPSVSKEHEAEKNNDFSFDDHDDFNEDDLPIAVQFGLIPVPISVETNSKKQPKRTRLKPTKEEGAKKRTRENSPGQTHSEQPKPSEQDFDF